MFETFFLQTIFNSPVFILKNELMRIPVFGWYLKKIEKKSKKSYEFVGPICESTDKFGSYKKFQKLKENDLIIICDVGAYGISLSSNYNLRPKPAEILVKKSKASVISKRQKLIEII